MSRIETDVLIIGAGAAGLVTALSAQRRCVTIITPDPDGSLAGAASNLAQGGLAAAVAPEDSTVQHLEDTLLAGGAEVQLAAARYLCEQAPSAVNYLASLGVPFDRVGETWSLHTEAAHSHARVLHVADATGDAIMRSLRRAVAAASHANMLHGIRTVQLLTNADEVCGVMAEQEDGRTVMIDARVVVIATGGIGGLYARTTNPITACGDGLAMALAAGARCSGLEFVQFHPTALDIEAARLPLLTEALRGAGARLIDEDGTRILMGVHPLAELAPRDIVARAVYLAQQRGSRVALDATHIDHLDIASAFPSVLSTCMKHGFDLRREPVPITPAAHYYMGGIAVDLDGRSSLPGLWAVGEAACTRAHGSNRLASNSLLEAVVFGRRCGHVLSTTQARASARANVFAEVGAAPVRGVPRQLREMLWQCMGVVRSARKLSQGMSYLAQLRERTAIDATLEHARLLLIESMLTAATRRTTNCGAHFRSDAIRHCSFEHACAEELSADT